VSARRRSSPYRRDVVAGIALVLIGVIGVYFAFAKRVPGRHGFRVEAIFTTSNHMRKGSPVRIAGVQVGRVAKVGRGPGSSARVSLELSRNGLPLHDDARAKIRPRIFLEGNYFVDLQPGSPGAPIMREGATIPVSRTAVPVQALQVFSTFDHPTRDELRRLLSSAATALGGGGAEGLNRAIPAFAPTFRDVARVAQAAQGTEPHDVSRAMGPASRLAAALSSRQDELADLIVSTRRTSEALAARQGALGDGIAELAGVIDRAPPALDALDSALPPVQRFADALRPALPIAPRALANIAGALEQLRRLSGPGEAPALLAQLRPLLADAPVFARQARPLLARVRDVSRCVARRVVPLLDAKVPDGALSTGQPVWQELVHALVGLGSSGQDFDANGNAIRLSFGVGEFFLSGGKLPGLGDVIGSTQNPVLGSHPRWLGPGVSPPYRPDKRCAGQAPPDLAARTGTAPR
jgi:phospholipid/cholesterol/gamma-HCH transport system substrate-binding protein